MSYTLRTWLHKSIVAVAVGFCAASLSPKTVASQQAGPAARYAVHGVVFDSVAGKPLTGALVQVGVVGSSLEPWTATTDTAGRYRLGGLPAGRYVIGFYHDALTALGLDAPVRTLEVGTEPTTSVDLAIPSSRAIRELRCGRSSSLANGMLVGFVRDAESRAAIAGASATIRWRAIALDSANYRVVEEHATATVEEDGTLLVCHLPVDAPLDLLVTAPGHRPLEGKVVTVATVGIGHLDVRLADSSLVTGTAIIRGRVTRESGKTVESGQVIIEALGRKVAVQKGEFVAANIPAGTWVAQVRVIGVEPQDVMVNASDSAVTTATITVSNGPQRLDAVTVVGKLSRDLVVLDEVLRRKRSSFGTTFLPGSPALRSAFHTADVLREARGFRFDGRSNAMVARYVGRMACRNIAIYVNGAIYPDGFASLDLVAPPNELLAIEAYPDVLFAPVQWRGNLGLDRTAGRGGGVCAVVLVWTKQPF